jgi:SAM-dependent methyltransferase/Flp pilus assembly protein TadD
MTTFENDTLEIESEQIEPAALTAEKLVAAADEALAGGDFARVRQKLRAAFELSPSEGEIALALGHAELNGGSLPAALEAYSAAAALLLNSPSAHACRALALQLLGRSPEAVQAARQAILLDPNQVIALKVLARIHLNAGKSDLAQQCCRRILSNHSNDGDARKMLGEALALQPNFPETTAKPALSASISTAVPVSENLKKLAPLMGDYASRTRAWRNLGPEHLLQSLSAGNYEAPIRIEQKPVTPELAPDGFPVPPVELTMGYGAGDLKHYLFCGARSAAMLRNVMARNGVTLQPGDSMLDWGGAAGRVLRNFAPEARQGVNVWGCDVHAPSIEWAKNHLSPPFKFFNSQTIPHLPFADGTFKFICGFSVFTHLIVMRDMWLLELRRILRPGGCITLTIHDENTWAAFRKNGMPQWMPAELRDRTEIPGELVDIRGSSWEFCYTFFHSDYIRRVWGQYFNVVEIVPGAESYQTAVVLKSL